jgi:triacylglycerol lipase
MRLPNFATSTLASRLRPASPGEHVVLLHGLARTRSSFLLMEQVLRALGYSVVSKTYPSTHLPVEQLLAHVSEAVAACGGNRFHFVAHSMGGILVRAWLAGNRPDNLGRVVMLAPPNAGSEVPDRFAGFPPFRWFTGQNGRRLTTAPDALPRALGPWPANGSELGIIAGDRPLNPLMASWLPKPNDGKVTVATTHLAGARDHVVVPYSHTWLAWRRDTIAQVKAFLREGHFARAAKPVGQIENDSQEPRYSAVGK